MKPFLQRSPVGDTAWLSGIPAGCVCITVSAIFSLTREQHHWGRNKIPFHISLSPEKHTESWEPRALKRLGPFPFSSVAFQNIRSTALPPLTLVLWLLFCS